MRRGHLPFLLLLVAGCAARRGPVPRDLSDAELAGAEARPLALAGWARWLRNDAAGAARRLDEALRRDGAEPWARLGAAALARRGLDDVEEARQLVLLVERAPGHPLAAVAAHRLGDLAERAPGLAEAVGAGLAEAAADGRLTGLTALRARAARAQAADVLGEVERARELRAQNGAVARWTVLGPLSPYHALDLDLPFLPEQGLLPARLEGPPGAGVVEARELPAADGVLGLDGEPPSRGDLFYLAADLEAQRGGDYLVAVGGNGSWRAWIDGRPVAERRALSGYPPASLAVPFDLAPGSHRLLVKATLVAGAPTRLAVSVGRADGAPSDVRATAARPGTPGPAVRPGPLPEVLNRAAALAARLEREAGPALARLVAARDALDGDRETAKALLEEALALLPGSAALLAARAEAHVDDPTLGDRIGRARAEAALERAMAADPSDPAARLGRAELMRVGDRLDDAQGLLAGLPEPAAQRPRALLAQARLALTRGFAEGAERLADEALRSGGLCAAADLLYDQADRRDAVARADELVRFLARCPGGRDRLADHLRRRGDLAGARAVLEPLVSASPARVDRRLELARVMTAQGDLPGSRAEVEALVGFWPREPRLEKRRAELLELSGDDAGARAARERALLLDGADLPLRRALALERGAELLADLAEDGPAALAAWRAAAPRLESSGAYALDHAAVEAHPDGAQTERTHQVVVVHDQRAVDRFGEVQVPPGAELLLARTLKRDGRVLEAEERGDKGTVSLPGLEPGDAAEFAWLRAIPARGPALPGFAADRFYFRGDLPMWRSAWVVAAPAGAGLRVEARHLEAPPVVRQGDRELVRAARERVPALLPEPGAPAESEYLPMLQVGAGAGPEALGAALSDAFADCCRPSLEIVKLAREIEASVPAAARGGEALVRAAHERVGELIQGQGGSMADQASQVLARGRGSRLLLLRALFEAMGVKARLALARDYARDPLPSGYPHPELYGVPLLRVEHGGAVHWLDASARQVPFGTVPPGVRGAEALVLGAPGEPPVAARVPDDSGAVGRELALVIQLSPDGSAGVEGTERWSGYDGASFRVTLERLGAQQRRQALEQLLSRSFPGGVLESLAFEGEELPQAPLRVRWRLAVPGWARVEEGRLTAEAPLHPARLSARFAQRSARETPLLVAAPERFTLRVEVNPPPGWRPLPRDPAEVRAPFGRYRRAERVEGGRLLREDGYALERARVAAGDWASFAAFAAAVDDAQAAPLVFVGANPRVAAHPLAASAKWAQAGGQAGPEAGHGP